MWCSVSFVYLLFFRFAFICYILFLLFISFAILPLTRTNMHTPFRGSDWITELQSYKYTTIKKIECSQSYTGEKTTSAFASHECVLVSVNRVKNTDIQWAHFLYPNRRLKFLETPWINSMRWRFSVTIIAGGCEGMVLWMSWAKEQWIIVKLEYLAISMGIIVKCCPTNRNPTPLSTTTATKSGFDSNAIVFNKAYIGFGNEQQTNERKMWKRWTVKNISFMFVAEYWTKQQTHTEKKVYWIDNLAGSW